MRTILLVLGLSVLATGCTDPRFTSALPTAPTQALQPLPANCHTEYQGYRAILVCS